MESANIISYISLGVSTTTAIFGFFIFLIYDRRLKKQAKDLNEKLDIIYDSQIDRIKKDEANQNAASFLVKPLPYNVNGRYIIRISNIGKVKAQDIRLGANTLSEDNGIIVNSFKTINSIDPMCNADFSIQCISGDINSYMLTLIWNDEKNIDNSKAFTINL